MRVGVISLRLVVTSLYTQFLLGYTAALVSRHALAGSKGTGRCSVPKPTRPKGIKSSGRQAAGRCFWFLVWWLVTNNRVGICGLLPDGSRSQVLRVELCHRDHGEDHGREHLDQCARTQIPQIPQIPSSMRVGAGTETRLCNLRTTRQTLRYGRGL